MNNSFIIKKCELFLSMAQSEICFFVDYDNTLVSYHRNIPDSKFYELYYGGYVVARPGINEFLQQLKQIGKLYICSYGTHSYVMDGLSAIGIASLFDDVFCREEILGEDKFDKDCSQSFLIDNLPIDNWITKKKLNFIGINPDEYHEHFIKSTIFEDDPLDAGFKDILAEINNKI